jgi:hypothetical protein
MALLRWIYLRKLTPIEDLIAGAGSVSPASPSRAQAGGARPQDSHGTARRAAPAAIERSASTASSPRPAASPQRPAARTQQPAPSTQPPVASSQPPTAFKDALLTEIRKSKAVFYNTVVAQAQKIEVGGDRVTFTFSANQRALRDRLESDRGWLEALAQKVAGCRIVFASVLMENGAAPAAASTSGGEASDAGSAAPPAQSGDRKAALKEQALADANVQALLEVFPAEIRDVEEM